MTIAPSPAPARRNTLAARYPESAGHRSQLPLRTRLRPLVSMLALTPLLAALPAFAQPVTHVVTTCNDAPVTPVCNGVDDGTLRQALRCAQDGDEVDLTQLQCSTITLSAPLVTGPVGLSVTGPGEDLLTISAGNGFRALVHNGRPGDTLQISGVIIRNGSYDNPHASGGGGGCIFSSANLEIIASTVTSCYTSATQTVATGGAIYAKGSVKLVASTVTASTATGQFDTKYASARGGGIFADTVGAYASVIAGNTAASPTEITEGGGVYARQFTAKYTTIAGNQATQRAGIGAGESLLLTNSTISGNSARDLDGGGHLLSGTAAIYNSTIAFNTAGAAGSTGGISALGLHLESSIIAHNTAAGVEADIATLPDAIAGSHNLIMAGSVPLPADTISADPLLGPLRDNGGLSPTHALLKGSPAIDHGANPQRASYDQAFATREAGPATDIGAYEFDRIFVGDFDPKLVAMAR